jgi:P4 family phage/plasmid primase-like protien
VDMLTAALAWHDAGCSVVRVAVDGTKAPLGAWKAYQSERADRATVAQWFEAGHPGIGVVCGAVSGHLEMLELEGRAVTDGLVDQLAAHLAADDAPGLLASIAAGYSEVSPGGGIHLLYRVADGVAGGVDGNTKLARRPGDPGPDGRPRVDVLVETRGEGGMTVVAPSGGPVHPSGRSWQTVGGHPSTIVTLTPAQRDTLHLAARALDAMPAPVPTLDPPVLDRERKPGEVTPGDDYTARASWREVLEPHGWTVARQQGDRTYWTRPGKTFGISAVTGGSAGDYLWVWSTSTELPSETAMSKWRVYAHLEHGGDFARAASALRRKGYGSPAPVATRPVLTVLPAMGGSVAVIDSAADAQADAVTVIGETLVHSDDANALALVDAYGHRIRHCAERGRWLHWTDRQWEVCPPGGGDVREMAKVNARTLPSATTADARHKQRALSAVGTTATLAQAETDRRITVPLAKLDAHPYELNTPAGILDLRTGEIGPHDPSHLHTRITAVAPDPDADPSRWLGFLADTFDGHHELIGYVQRLLGYSVTGRVAEPVLPFCHGDGANGKTVFLETVRAVLGDYATSAPAGFLMAKNYASHETEIARLAGARLVVCSEVGERDKFDEVRVKQLTGGDALTARFMRTDHFTFTPTHTLWLLGNHQPAVHSGGHSLWRRLRLIPFTNTVPEERRVKDLQGILATDHGPAVLAWIVAGAVAYFADGLRQPESVSAATADYEHEQDTIYQFVSECCHIGGAPHVQTLVSTVREAYEDWCRTQGLPAATAIGLGKKLRSRYGVTSTPGGRRGRHYVGLSLVDGGDSGPERLDLA